MTSIDQPFHAVRAQTGKDASALPAEDDQGLRLDWYTLSTITFAALITVIFALSTVWAFALSIAAFLSR